ncbi:UNVERIFIED_CONTAM: hypothetical protein Scaly_1004100 [Sesamum calycinum]|uniref:DUF4283 domain-containing protein n=1 Tax=Sesamum calycinum TaxID=2727403 RepID=A0AAW2QZU9_9LAMI
MLGRTTSLLIQNSASLGQPSKPLAEGQPALMPATAPITAKTPTNGAEVGNNDFQSFLSGLESSPLFAAKAKHGSQPKNVLPTKNMPSATEATAKAVGMMNMPAIAPVLIGKLDQGHQPKGTQPAKETLPVYETLPATKATAGAEGKAQSFAGLFSSNRKLSDDNKLTKFAVEPETLELGADDLIDVRTKLGYCLVGYIAGKVSGVQATRTLSKSWGSLFQLHDSGWFIFRFAQDDDRQRVLAGGPYFVYGRPLILKAMPDCFEFKEDSISLTPVWATLPSLPLECWHPNALVDASKPLVDQVDFMLPNSVMRSQPVVYDSYQNSARSATGLATWRGLAKAANRPLPQAGKGVQGQSAALADKVAKERLVQLAGKQAQNQPGSPKPQQSVIAPAQKAGLRTQSSIDSSGSSDETDSQTSTQHLMPGTSSADVAQTKPKSGQKIGGEYLPPST